MYDLIYSDLALRQLKRLERETQRRIIATLERCRVRPHAHVKKLVSSQYFRLRAGDWRIIVDIQQNKLLIFVIEVGHRENIYN